MNTMPSSFIADEIQASVVPTPIIDLSSAARLFAGDTVDQYVAKLKDPTISAASRTTIQFLLPEVAAKAGVGFTDDQIKEYGFGVNEEGKGMPFIRPQAIYTIEGQVCPLTPYTFMAAKGP